jgi:hypothetical protein
MKSFDKRKLSVTTQNYARINVILLRKNLLWKKWDELGTNVQTKSKFVAKISLLRDFVHKIAK